MLAAKIKYDHYGDTITQVHDIYIYVNMNKNNATRRDVHYAAKFKTFFFCN